MVVFAFMEVWKKIKGFENYEVSNYGNIRRMYLKGYKYRKPVIQKGYCSINFVLNKTGFKKIQIHRLVAEAFIENNENKKCINHINGIKNDNRVDNLEWCTHSENEKHSFGVLGKISNGIIKRKIPLDEIEKIKILYNSGMTQKKIAILYNVNQSTISYLVNNKTYQKWL
jgi:hypothetical protein